MDINKATAKELATLPGVGPKLAERIIEHRKKHGPFRTLKDLAAVSGLSEQLISRWGNLATVGSGREPRRPVDPKPTGSDTRDSDESRGLTLTVELVNDKQRPYPGYQLAVRFEFAERFGDDDQDVLWIHKELNRPVDANNRSVFGLPSRDALRGEVLISATAPDGEQQASLRRTPKTLADHEKLELLPTEFAAPSPNDDPGANKPQRLRGQVIDNDGQAIPAGTQVVIWGAQTGNRAPKPVDFRALIVAETDASGRFNGPYPLGDFSAAHGSVAGAVEQTTPVHLVDKALPDTVLLVVDFVDDKDPAECHCEDVDEPPRNPDEDDLANATGVYSKDLGSGRCVDFTTPDRTIDEFGYSYVVRTTEPEIRSLTLDEPNKIDIGKIIKVFPYLTKQKLVRTATFDSSSDGEREMAAVAADTRLQHIDARIVKTLAKDPDGFSLTKLANASRLSHHGDLLRLIGKHIKPAPSRNRLDCRKPVDWDDEPTVYQACTIAHGHVLRFKQEWLSDGYSMGDLLYSLPLAPAQQKQLAIVDWERRESNALREQQVVTEDLDNELSRDRDINEIVRGTLRESTRGGSKASSGAFGGGLGLGFIGSGFGGLLGIGGGKASASSSAWQRSSRDTAASSLQQLRDRTRQSASAVRSKRTTVVQSVSQGERLTVETETIANYNHCHAMTVQYFEVLRHMLVRQRLTDVQECLFVPLLMSSFDQEKALRWRHTLKPMIRRRKLRLGFDAIERIANNYAGTDLPTGAYADDTVNFLEGDIRLRFQLARPRDEDDEFHPPNWGWLGLLLPSTTASEFYKRHLREQAHKDRVFIEQLGPQIARRIVEFLQVRVVLDDDSEINLPVDPTLMSNFRNNAPMHLSLRLADTLPPVIRARIKAVKLAAMPILGNPWINVLPANSRILVDAATIRYRTDHHSDYLVRDGRIANDLTETDDVLVFTPLNRRELRRPRDEDREAARQLLDHLNEFIERYHHAIWWRMSPDRRYMLLDGFQAPNSSGRSVASVVENELIGIVGNSLIMPVARGYHLDPTFNQDDEDPVDLLDHYQPNTPLEPVRIAVPTKGVYAEAVMGACNSCEFKEEDRFWRWQEAPIPLSPTSIQPVSTDSRRADAPPLKPSELPAPIVNLQNAPAAPDPTGLGAALQLLGQANAFKDITGLEGNQQNAAAALKGALDTAQFFGGKAADLALQGSMQKDIDKTLKTIQQAKDNEIITGEQAQALGQQAIQSMLGGGAQLPKQSGLTSNPEIKQAISKASESKGGQVNVSRTTSLGSESVSVANDAKGSVPVIIENADLTADSRSFHAKSDNKSGQASFSVRVPDMPAGGSIRWSVPPAETGDFTLTGGQTAVTGARVTVNGITPGKSNIDVAVRDADGNTVQSMKLPLSIPQFVTIDEDAAAFDQALTDFGVLALKNDIIGMAKFTCDHLLQVANVRTIWRLGTFNEVVPAHLPANVVTTVTLRNQHPTSPTLLGQTINAPGATGNIAPNRTINLYPNAIDESPADGSPDPTELDVETKALILQLESQGVMGDIHLENFATKVFGRLIGETLAHEIVHALLWDIIPPDGHNDPAIANDLMNFGSDRNFRQRCGFQDNAHSSPVDPLNFTDHGVNGIGGLQVTNRGRIDAHFPVLK